ncbi:MAG: Holliday junction branch migration DNA helicase RuvB [Dehalococcoidia bacterium]|nr:Holliday junction branch migration DNA helicase RuvB [Dehalococcoidia bacterium]
MAEPRRPVPAPRLVSGKTREEDLPLDQSLRPRRLAEFVGQDKVKDNLQIAIEAAQARHEPLDHLLFYGPPGLGKTTLAHIVASEMGVSIRETTGPAIERAGDLASILNGLQAEDVLFIDEIHRLPRPVEELLYPAMEDFVLHWVLPNRSQALGAKSIRLPLKPFTIIGATTRIAMLTGPLRDRFGQLFRLEFYDHPAMVSIVRRSARILGIAVEEAAIGEIAQRARGTPRVANRLLRRLRDYAQVRAQGLLTPAVALEALARLEVDELGLEAVDNRLLRVLIEKFDGGPVGLETMAASISEEADTIMDVYEPYLLQLGFLARTPRGRMATRPAYEHLGIPFPAGRAAPQMKMWESELNVTIRPAPEVPPGTGAGDGEG